MASICVFCGARSGTNSEFADAAGELGRALAGRGDSLVFGGGSVGLMGIIADEVLAAGGTAIGVIPEALATVELTHPGVEDMRVVPDMHARKAAMHQLADGYIALPGGYGTLEELFEVLCWAQLDFHRCPIAVLNLNGYYDGLTTMADRMIKDSFLDDKSRKLLQAVPTTKDLTAWLDAEFPVSKGGCRTNDSSDV